MLSEAVMQQVGDQNPVVVAAQAQGFSTDLDFLNHVATEKGVSDEVKTSFIDAYEESRGQKRPSIPYFAVRAIEEAIPNRLAETQEQVRKARTKPKSQKQPPRQCKPPRR